MARLLPPVYYGSDEERAALLEEAEAKGRRLVYDERDVGSDRSKPHRLTFEEEAPEPVYGMRSSARLRGHGEATLPPGLADLDEEEQERVAALADKLRQGSASLQDVIEYLRLRDGL